MKILFSCNRKQNHKGHRSQLLSRGVQMCWGGSISAFVSPSPADRTQCHPRDNEVHTVRKVCVGLKSQTQPESEANMVEWYLHHASDPGSILVLHLLHSLGNTLVSWYQTVHRFRVKLGFWGRRVVLCFRMLFLMIMQSRAVQNHV